MNPNARSWVPNPNAGNFVPGQFGQGQEQQQQGGQPQQQGGFGQPGQYAGYPGYGGYAAPQPGGFVGQGYPGYGGYPGMQLTPQQMQQMQAMQAAAAQQHGGGGGVHQGPPGSQPAQGGGGGGGGKKKKGKGGGGGGGGGQQQQQQQQQQQAKQEPQAPSAKQAAKAESKRLQAEQAAREAAAVAKEEPGAPGKARTIEIVKKKPATPPAEAAADKGEPAAEQAATQAEAPKPEPTPEPKGEEASEAADSWEEVSQPSQPSGEADAAAGAAAAAAAAATARTDESSAAGGGDSKEVSEAADAVAKASLSAKASADAAEVKAAEEAEEAAEEAAEAAAAAKKSTAKKTKAAERTDLREHLNCVFIGHVDAGKSTFCGQVMLTTGQVDERTMQKYEKEAKEKNRESWFLAYIMDTDEEERAKGKTVQVGRAHFDTDKKRYTILDAPGHKNYVPNMIAGACQADIGVLVISARKGEFETGFERGGQTREHALLAKTLGVRLLLVAVNKMDDPTVEWSEERYKEIMEKLSPFLKQCGYNVKKDVQFVPMSALKGTNVMKRVDPALCPWYTDQCFLEILDALPPTDRKTGAPMRLPIIDKYRDMGTVVEGKVEQGELVEGEKYILLPNRDKVVVEAVSLDEEDVAKAFGGENVKVKLKDISDEDIKPGFVLSCAKNVAPVVRRFEAQLIIVELLEHKSIFSAGYGAILHLHAIAEECSIVELTSQIDKKTGKKSKKPPMFVKSGAVITCIIEVEQNICIETFDACPQLGRFTLRDEGKTIGIGKVLKLLDTPEAGKAE